MKIYNITDFGAIGDGKTLNTAAIQTAIDECAKSGGGRVLIADGIYKSGGIRLYTNVNLHIEQNAVLLGSGNPGRYITYISFTDCSFAITDGSEFADRPHHGFTGLTSFEPYQPMTIKYAKNISFNNTTITNI